MQALLNAPGTEARLSLRTVAEPEPRDDEAVVRVHTFSLNRGELALMRNRPDGWRPGQDIAGVVERPAKNGKGPGQGELVAALIEGAGWAERVAVPLERLARVPSGVSLDQAAGLPMAGLTALALLRRCGPVIGRSMGVTGASGGVGTFLTQLGNRAGAEVVAVARPEHASWLLDLGAARVTSGMAAETMRFDIILESVGGASLQDAVAHIHPGGRIVCFGNSSGTKAEIDLFSFFGAENASIETFFSYRAMTHAEIGTDLGYLLGLVQRRALVVQTANWNWSDVRTAIETLEARGTRGKIVVTIGQEP